MNNFILQIPIKASEQQAQSLAALQKAFADVCNALTPMVRDSRCWHRVTLHHMAYRTLRERFPRVGSQMVCNAIYSVSRTCRVIFQSPGSPLNINRLTNKPLPLLEFLPSGPVYFDRHTLSIRRGVLSMYTLDGRMRFHVELLPKDEARFISSRLQEIVLRGSGQQFSLSFSFAGESGPEVDTAARAEDWPQYVVLQDVDMSTCNEVLKNFPTSIIGSGLIENQVGVMR